MRMTLEGKERAVGLQSPDWGIVNEGGPPPPEADRLVALLIERDKLQEKLNKANADMRALYKAARKVISLKLSPAEFKRFLNFFRDSHPEVK